MNVRIKDLLGRRRPQAAALQAERLRALTWPDSVPVDPVVIARRLGVKVVDAYLDSDLGGALVKEVGQDPVFLLNQEDSNTRKRLVCARLLGRFAAPSENVDEYFHVERREQEGETSGYAAVFARELLMPRWALERAGRSEFLLARFCDVPRKAAINRLAPSRRAA